MQAHNGEHDTLARDGECHFDADLLKVPGCTQGMLSHTTVTSVVLRVSNVKVATLKCLPFCRTCGKWHV